MAGRAGDAGGDHAAAALVPLPPEQGLVLVRATTIVPLSILLALKPRARNPRRIGIDELFTTPPEREWHYFPRRNVTEWFFLTLDRVIALGEWSAPRALRRRAIDKALEWCMTRLNGEDGLGAIFPPMANVLMAFDTLGYPQEHPARQTARRAIDLLLADPTNGSQYCQPCVSPVWDTGLAALGLMECGTEDEQRSADASLPWLADLQINDVEGDWAVERPDAPPGGWAFQYRNDYYPDVDDTAVVGMALHRADAEAHREAIDRAAAWIVAMQNENGGWGAFDAENERYYLNRIPFADHGALLDPADRRRQRALRELPLPDRLFARAPYRRQGTRLPARQPGRPTAPGSAAGGPTTSTAPGRCCAR